MNRPLRLGVIGDPVTHSLSPRFQTAALKAAGIAGEYTALPTQAGSVARRLAELAGEGYDGLNVTLPLKEETFAFLAADSLAASRLSPLARRLGAVNTLRREGATWVGHNSDFGGFRRAALARMPSLSGIAAVILGAGGVARAVALCLMDAGAERIWVWNRSPERLERFLGDLMVAAGGSRLIPLPAQQMRCPAGAQLLVQATSLGLEAGDPLPPLPAKGERPFAMDLVSHPTPWQEACRQSGCSVDDGREMLLWQGAESFTFWTGRRAPLSVMREALYP